MLITPTNKFVWTELVIGGIIFPNLVIMSISCLNKNFNRANDLVFFYFIIIIIDNKLFQMNNTNVLPYC